jgi:superfamily II DNA or RNA helicase
MHDHAYKMRPYQADAGEAIHTTLAEFNRALVVMATGCLTGDTELIVNRGGGARKTRLDTIVHNFHGTVPAASNGRLYGWDLSIPTYTQSVDEEGFGRLNRIEQAFDNGVNEVFLVRTASGQSIRATAAHHFLTPDGWVELGELRAGDAVYHLAYPKVGDKKAKGKNIYVQVGTMDNHPFASVVTPSRRANTKIYRVAYHRLVAEAVMNGLTVDALISRIRSGFIEGLAFLDPKEIHVHHKDGNHLNNRPDNLQPIPSLVHLSLHGKSEGWKHLAGGKRETRIASIERAGEERVYDLRMADPMNNYVANGLVVHNSGKTILFAKLSEDCLKRRGAFGRAKGRVLILVNREELLQQARDKILAVTGIFASIERAQEHASLESPIIIATIQTLQKRLAKYPQDWPSLVIVDEAHLFATPKIIEVLDHFCHPDGAMLLGFTATPHTKGKRALSKVYETIAYEKTIASLIEDGFLCNIKVQTVPIKIDISAVRSAAGDFIDEDLEVAIEPYFVAVAEAMKAHPGRRWLCFLPLIHTSKRFTTILNQHGIVAEHVDGKSDDRAEILRRFKEGKVQAMCNSLLVTTGYDEPSITGIVNLRPTKSRIMLCLDSQTEILTSHGWKGMGAVSIGDCVASCDEFNHRRGKWSMVTGVVQRDMSPSEKWVSHKGPHSNFRVTDGHRMLWAPSRIGRRALPGAAGHYNLSPARELCLSKQGVKMPAAIHMDQAGLPLSDSELYFIGMMMTDGTWTEVSGSISQSERHPEIIERIELSLAGCGIGYTKRKQSAPPSDALIPSRFDRWRFSLSCGNLRKKKGTMIPGRGFRYLLPFLSKDLAPSLMQISKRQLYTLLSGLWDGDGFKLKSPSIDWTTQTISICTSRKLMADRLQALCAINGMRANLSVQSTGRKQPIYVLSIKEVDWRSCGGTQMPGRSQIELLPATTEQVWCIECEQGTIVTRREGKVTVMGNCQILGRGTRLKPEGSAHDDLLVLDPLWQTPDIEELMTPAALFAAKDEDEAELAKRLRSGDQLDLADVHAMVVADRHKKLAEALRANESKKANLMDFRALLALGLEKNQLWEEAIDYEPTFQWEEAKPSKVQIDTLFKFGFDVRLIRDKGHASKVLQYCFDRIKRKLATFKQVRALQRAGYHVDPNELRIDEASRMLSDLYGNRR